MMIDWVLCGVQTSVYKKAEAQITSSIPGRALNSRDVITDVLIVLQAPNPIKPYKFIRGNIRERNEPVSFLGWRQEPELEASLPKSPHMCNSVDVHRELLTTEFNKNTARGGAVHLLQ